MQELNTLLKMSSNTARNRHITYLNYLRKWLRNYFMTRIVLVFLLSFWQYSVFACTPSPTWPTVKFASSEWPPFTGKDLPGHGATVQKVVEVLCSIGLNASVDFFSWQELLREIRKVDSPYIGYLPEYQLADDRVVLSAPLEQSEVGLAVLDPTLHNLSFEQLTQKRIGVVKGYINTQYIDQAIEQKQLNPVYVDSDIANIQLAANGKVDAIVIDKKVLRYLIQTQLPNVSAFSFIAPYTEIKTLHIAFLQRTLDRELIAKVNEKLRFSQQLGNKVLRRPVDVFPKVTSATSLDSAKKVHSIAH